MGLKVICKRCDNIIDSNLELCPFCGNKTGYLKPKKEIKQVIKKKKNYRNITIITMEILLSILLFFVIFFTGNSDLIYFVYAIPILFIIVILSSMKDNNTTFRQELKKMKEEWNQERKR